MDAEITGTGFALHTTSPQAAISVARPVGTIASLLLADMIAIVSATLLSFQVREVLIGGPTSSIPELALTASMFTGCSFVAARLYSGVCDNPVAELRRTVLAITLSFLCLGASTFVFHDLSHSRLIVLGTYVFSILLVHFLAILLFSVVAFLSGLVALGFHALITL